MRRRFGGKRLILESCNVIEREVWEMELFLFFQIQIAVAKFRA